MNEVEVVEEEIVDNGKSKSEKDSDPAPNDSDETPKSNDKNSDGPDDAAEGTSGNQITLF